MRASRVLLSVIPLGLAAPACLLSWSTHGHETVCEIAFQELTEKAKSQVKQIMEAEPLPQYRTFRRGCTWPDGTEDHPQAGERRKRRTDGSHYINVPRTWTFLAASTCPPLPNPEPSCLFRAIEIDCATLESASATPAEKVTALKFLGHWLGDLHQPLHVSFRDDRGGNAIAVVPELCDGGDDLHGVWDKCIPDDRMEERHVQGDSSAFAKILRSTITASDRKKWTADVSLESWASESLHETRKHAVRYCKQRGGSCVPDQTTLKLTGAYEDRHGKLVERRLKQAGVRLAAILNEIFQ